MTDICSSLFYFASWRCCSSKPENPCPSPPCVASSRQNLVNGGRPYFSQMSNWKRIGVHAIPKMRWHVGAAWMQGTFFFADAVMRPSETSQTGCHAHYDAALGNCPCRPYQEPPLANRLWHSPVSWIEDANTHELFAEQSWNCGLHCTFLSFTIAQSYMYKQILTVFKTGPEYFFIHQKCQIFYPINYYI